MSNFDVSIASNRMKSKRLFPIIFDSFLYFCFSHLLQKPKPKTNAFKTAKKIIILKTAKEHLKKALFNVANPPMTVWTFFILDFFL